MSNTFQFLCSLDLQCSFPLDRLDGRALQIPFNIHIEYGWPCGLMDRCSGMRPVISVPPENMLHICEVLMLNRPLISNFAFFPCGCFASCTTVRLINMSMHFSCSQCAPSITISCWIASYCFDFLFALYGNVIQICTSYFSFIRSQKQYHWGTVCHPSIIPHK